jgi:hypothetical protein
VQPAIATIYLNGVEVETVKLPFLVGVTADSHAVVGSPPPDAFSGSAAAAPPLITKPASALSPADVPATVAMRLQSALGPLTTTASLAWSLAALHLFDSAVTPAQVTGLYAVGPHYGGQCFGSDAAGSVTPLRPLLAASHLERLAVTAAAAAATQPADVNLDAAVDLPPATGVILSVSAALASRVLNNPPPEAEHGDGSEWSTDMDHYHRLHLQDRGPSTAAERMTCVQCISSVGILTGFLEGYVVVSSAVQVCMSPALCACSRDRRIPPLRVLRCQSLFVCRHV